MKSVVRVVKGVACIFGGACAAAFAACVVALLLFGLHDLERIVPFLKWIRVAAGLSAAAGAFIVFRSERQAAS